MTTEERLKQYIDNDEVYQDYKNGNINLTDFEKFCIQHCKDIEEILEENQELKSELELYENGVYYSSELDKKDKEIEELKKQQEEFLELLEGMHFETKDKWWLKILEKYKEIIGGKYEEDL